MDSVKEVPQVNIGSNLTSPITLKVISLVPQDKLKRCRFRSTSYSPFVELMAEHLTEAEVETSFSGQPNSPSRLRSY